MLDINDVKERALQLGFSSCGIAKAVPLIEAKQRFEALLNSGAYEDMPYLHRNIEKRFTPDLLLPGCKSVIVCLYDYWTRKEKNRDYKISKYALLQDYHLFMKEKLYCLAEGIDALYPGGNYKITIDTSPVSEKNWAVKAGLGFIGKNTLFQGKNGSFCFIGLILTTIEFPVYDEEHCGNCGTCTCCIDACPTGALATPYHLNASQCISYQTIEKKTSSVLEPGLPWVFGCDTCQEVCPRNAGITENPDAIARVNLWSDFENEDFESLSIETYRELIKKTPMERVKFEKFKQEIERVRQYLS